MKSILIMVYLGLVCCQLAGQPPTDMPGKEIIYGRKDGMALTMIMLSPKSNGNGKAIVSVVSGAWYSRTEWIPDYVRKSETLLQRGYTVFLVMPSGRPRFSIPDGIADAKRSVRFVRYHAAEYNIDPAHIGITGTSSGGQLSLAVATDDDIQDTDSTDPVDRVSSRVQAAACFYPPTDFLHWGNVEVDPKNKYVLDEADVYAAFEFKEWDPAHKNYRLITDQQKIIGIYKLFPPSTRLVPTIRPVLIAHGTADFVVPFSQSEKFMEKLRQSHITCELLVKAGWPARRMEQ